jgi:hypothetical protein
VACIYNLRAGAALFLEEENLVHAEHFVSKLAYLRVILLEGKSLDMFSCLKDFVKNSVETNDIGTYQYIKDHFVNLQLRFSKYFPDAVINTNGSWIHSMLIRSKITFFLEEGNYIDILDTSLKVQLPRKSYIEFWVGIAFSDLSRKALNILLPFATYYHLCETGFSAVAAIKTKYRSMMNLENDVRAAI